MPSITSSKPSRQVKLDKVRSLRFNWSAACRFEESYGRSIPEAMQAQVGVRLISHLAWAGMLHDEPGLTMREAERRIQSYINQDGDIAVFSQELIAALIDSGVLGKIKAQPTDAEAEAAEAAEGNEQAGE